VLTDWKKKLALIKPKLLAENKQALKITDEKLVPGRIIEIDLTREDGIYIDPKYKTRTKFIVIISVDNDRVVYASFLINSLPSKKTKLADLQFPLYQKDYINLLEHRSYLDCSYLLPIDRPRLIAEGKDRGIITEKDFEIIYDLIKNAFTIEPKVKKHYNII
jgi:hypothetical protein